MLFKAAVQASQRIALSRAGKQYGKIKKLADNRENCVYYQWRLLGAAQE
jgi:hypothetical protein